MEKGMKALRKQLEVKDKDIEHKKVCATFNPRPQTPSPTPQTTDSKPQIPNPLTLNPKLCPLTP